MKLIHLNLAIMGSGSFRGDLPQRECARSLGSQGHEPIPLLGHSGSAAAQRRTIRVGVLVERDPVPAWYHTMISEILALDCCRVVLVLKPSKPSHTLDFTEVKSPSAFDSHDLRSVFRRSVFAIYDRLIDRHPIAHDSVMPRSLASLLSGIPSLTLRSREDVCPGGESADTLAAIRGAAVDVLVGDSRWLARGDIAETARYGIWAMHIGDIQDVRSGPPGLWQSMEGWPVTGAELRVRFGPEEKGAILARTHTRTDPWSVRETNNRTNWKALAMVPRALRRLHAQGSEALFAGACTEASALGFDGCGTSRAPTTRELAALVSRKVLSKAALLWRNRRWFDQWILAYHFGEDSLEKLGRYNRLIPPSDRFWADPHAVEVDGRHVVFLEDYSYVTGKGTIAVLEFDEHGTPGQPRTVLERPYHLSYPFVFLYEDTWYMIPESGENRTVELYRCVQFPGDWVFERTLIDDINAVDATLLEHSGRWWMFVNVVEHEGASTEDELFLFHTQNPIRGEWQPHPGNPVVSDCRTARPAGRFFEQDGVLYRPSQYSVHRYGYGLNLNRVVQLDERHYREELVTRTTPDLDPDIVGIHSFTKAGQLQIVDALYRRRRER